MGADDVERRLGSGEPHLRVELGTVVDPQALRQAVQALLQRHACLRSVFGTYEGRTVRFVQQAFAAPFEVYDRANATRSEIATEIARVASQPFDLRTGPVLRVRLFQTSAHEQTLLLTAHHILADFWSLGIALLLARSRFMPHRRVGSDRGDQRRGGLRRVRPLGSEARAGPPRPGSSRHWQLNFGDGLDFCPVPDRPAVAGHPGCSVTQMPRTGFTIDNRTVERLRQVGHAHDSTLFAVMLALFNVLIYTYTRQTSIAVISPVSVRSRLGFENLVGALGNHLLLRSRLDETQEFTGFLRQVRQGLVDAMVHRDFPASLATRRVRVRGMPPGGVPFPLKFNMPKAHMIDGDMTGTPGGPSRLTLALEALSAELKIIDRRVTGNSELNLGCFETRSGLLGTVQDTSSCSMKPPSRRWSPG